MEFLISFKDIDTENDNHELETRLYDYCQPAPGLLLESDLGLDRLINAALMPVETGVLKPGRNFGPGASPPPAIPKADLEATSIETKTQAIINNVVKPRYSVAQGALDASCLKAVTEAQLEAIAQSANVSAYVINIDKAAETVSNQSSTSPPTPADDAALKATAKQSSADLKKLIDGRDEVIKATNAMKTAMETCTKITKDLDDAKKNDGPTVYDPVSSITETINFYVTVTGSVTPTWKLVRVTAPTAGTFLSGTRKDTNTLILTMGRPTPGTNGGPPDTRAMNAQTFNSILQHQSFLGHKLPMARLNVEHHFGTKPSKPDQSIASQAYPRVEAASIARPVGRRIWDRSASAQGIQPGGPSIGASLPCRSSFAPQGILVRPRMAQPVKQRLRPQP